MTFRRMGIGLSHARVRRSMAVPIPYGAVGPAVMFLDVATILAASLTAGIGYHQLRFADQGQLWHFLGVGLLTAALFVPPLRYRGLYRPNKLLCLGQQVTAIFSLWLMVILVLLAMTFVTRVGDDLSRGAMVGFLALGFAALGAQRMLVRHAMRVALSSGSLRGPRVAVFTLGQPRHRISSAANLQRFGYRIAQHHHLPSPLDDEAAMREEVLAALRTLRGSDVEQIYVVGNWHDLVALGDPLELFRETPLPVQFMPDPATVRLLDEHCSMLGRSGAVTLKRAPLSDFERLSKRGLDILVASVAVVMLAPLLMLTALAVKFDSPGPAFFVQRRNGFNGRPFRIFKFRTMSVQEDGARVTQARRNDSRVTRVGYWLRRTSLDELPQLFNVLLGDMSIVGPRPHALAHDDHYARLIGNYAHRHHVKPGITGLAQISGFRGETQTVDLMERRIEMDLRYIGNWSFWGDVSIIVRTAAVLVWRPNAY